jgi:hypothetical protein
MRKTAAPISYHWLSNLILLGASVTWLAGCVIAPPPYEEFALARSAVRSAQEFDSARFATAAWNKADEAFRNGQKAFKDGDFDQAKVLFVSAQREAERAENATRLKKFQSGDSFP